MKEKDLMGGKSRKDMEVLAERTRRPFWNLLVAVNKARMELGMDYTDAVLALAAGLVQAANLPAAEEGRILDVMAEVAAAAVVE